MGIFNVTSQERVTTDPTPPDRSTRTRCWTARDEYFACLETHHRQNRQTVQNPNDSYYFVPGREIESVCMQQRIAYHSLCAKSWVEHFNKRVVNEQRSVANQVVLSKPR